MPISLWPRAVDHNGGLLGIESFGTDPARYEALLGWLAGFRSGATGWGGGHRVVECRPGPVPR